MRTLITRRLVLKSFDEKYLGDFYEYCRRPEVGPAAGWTPHKSIDESLQIIKSFVKSDDNYMVTLRDSGKLIGSVGLHPDKVRCYSNSIEIGYVLSPDYWGRGLMTEAVTAVLWYCFCDRGLSVVTVAHFPTNSRSRRVIEKLGFTYEGVVRDAFVHADGTKSDEMRYHMTADRYFSLYSPQTAHPKDF